MIYGFLGALLAMALVVAGAVCGWLVCKAVIKHTKPELENPGEKERQRLIEQQQAFRQMQNYSVEQAYGMTGGDG
jgi:hypothetical protein